MQKSRRLTLLGICTAALTTPVSLMAQGHERYPSRTVRIIVPFPTGQATDIIARLLADRLSDRWGQSVYVENKGGGANIPGMIAGRDAAADGYTITFASSTTTAVNEALYPKLPYKMKRDFVPIAPVFTQPWLIVAHPSAPYDNLKDVVDAARKEPGKLTWGFGATALEMAAELFKDRAGVDILGVSYKGSGPAVTDLMGGHIQLGLETMASTLPQIKAGRLKVLASLSDKRSAHLPEVLTVAEQGYPGFLSFGWAGLFAPKDTPPAIVEKISSDVQAILRDPSVQQAVHDRGSEPDLRNRSEWASFVEAETVKWAEVIKKGKIKLPE